ncbi:Hypothetical protein NTJ_07383 [Nesidiocoris tenuis]|uniref:Uncharacterized protein n=1 Tax=Nesidiocoris tenuis TaxID=355587 RepID=A0ABN7ATF4_9HEMI|nr:Hypothetical protein NTJ_07383 [Nesidiocoris tenuis]
MDPAKPTTSKKHAEITKVFQEKIKRKEKLILLLKELLRVRDENFRSKYQQHLAPALLNWQENFDALKKELLVSATSTHTIVQAKEEYRRRQEETDKSLKAKDGLIAHLEFQTKQLSCALNEFKAKEKSWNDQNRQEKKSGISFTIGGKKKKLKDSPLDDFPPTPESSISTGSRSNLISESPPRGNITPPTSISSSLNPTFPWLESLEKEKSPDDDSDSDDSCLTTVVTEERSPKRSPNNRERTRSNSLSSCPSDDDDRSSDVSAEINQPSPKKMPNKMPNKMLTSDEASSCAAAVASGLSIFDLNQGNDCSENEANCKVVAEENRLFDQPTDDSTALSTVITDPPHHPTLPAEKMDAPVKDEDRSSSSDLIVLAGNPVTNDATITEPSGDVRDCDAKKLEDLFELFDAAKKDLSGLSSDLDLSVDKSRPFSIRSPAVYKSDTEEELDYSYDLPVASIPAEEDLLSVSPLPVDPILTPDLPSADQDGSKKQLRVDGSKECKATFAIEETLGPVTTVPELPAAEVTPHCEVDAVVNRNETELVNSSGTNDEPLASSSSPGRAVSPKPSQSPTEENLPQRKTRFRKRKASESSSVSEASELSNLAEPLDKQMAADVGSIASDSQLNGLERISEHTSNDDGFATPSSPIIAPRRSPRHIKSPAAQQVTPCVRKSPRKRAVKIKSPQQAEDQNSAQATSESPQRCLDVSDLQDGPSILGQSQSIRSCQSPEETPASDDIAEETPAIEDRTLVAALTPAENCAPGKAAPGRSQTNLESPTKKPESSLGKISPEVGDTPDSEQASEFDWSNSSKTSQSATLKSSATPSESKDSPKLFGGMLSPYFRFPHLTEGPAAFRAQQFESFADFAQSQTKALETGSYRCSSSFKGPIHIDTGDSRGRGADESFLCNLIFGQLCWSFQLLSIQKSDNGCLLKRSSKPDKSPLCGQSDIAGFSIIGNQRCLGKPSFSDGQAKSKFNTYREAALPTEIKEEHDVDSEVAPSMFPGHFFGDQHRFRACSDKFVPDSIQYSGVMSPWRTAPKSHPGFMQSSANSVSSHNYFPFSRSNFKGEGPANGCHSCGPCNSRSFHNGLLMTSNRAVNHRYVPPDANSPQSWSHCRNAQFPSPTTEIQFQNHCKSAKTSQIATEVPTIDLTEPRSDLVAHKAGLQGTPLIPSTSPFLNRLPPQFGDNVPFKFPKDPAGFGKPKFLRSSERALISPSRLSGTSEVPVVFVDKTQDTKGDVRCMSSPDMSVDSVNSLKVSSHLPAGLQRNEPISDSKSCTGSIGQNPASLNNLNPSTLSLDTHDTPTNPDSLLQQGQAKQAQLENLIKTSKASPSKKSPKNDTKDSKVSHASHRSPVKCSNNTNDAKASHAFHQSSPKRLNGTKDPNGSHATHQSPSKCSKATKDPKASHASHQSPSKCLSDTNGAKASQATHQSPSKCSKVTKDPKASHASPQSTPTKLRRMSSGSPSKSIVRPAHSERLIPNLPMETPTQSKAQVSKSDIGSLRHGTGSVGVPVNTGCEVLLEASVREVAPEKCSNPLPTPQKAVNCDQTASSSAKKRMLPPNALRSRGGLRNLVSGSKPFEDTYDKSSGSLFSPGAPSKHQNASAEQPEAQDDSPRAQKKSSVSKSTKKNARLKSAKKDQNSEVGQSEKPAMQVTKDAGCSCHQLYDHCICQVERIMLEVACANILLPFPPSPGPLKKKKSENCEKRAIDRPKFPKKTPPPEEPPETKRSRTRKRKLSETKSVPCKKKSLQFKSAEFVDDSSDSDSQITKRTSEGSLAENGAKRDEPASKAISGCNIEEDQPKTLQRFSDIVEDADPLSDEAVLAADISESSPPEVNNSEVIVDECSEIVGISSTAPDPATHGSPGVISSNFSTVELEHNYPSQFAMSPPTRPPKDPLSNRPNELNHLANFFQRSSSYGPSLPVADSDGGDDLGNGSDSDGDSQMLIDEQSSRCPESLSPAESSNGEIGEKPLSYWPETAVVHTSVSEPIAVPNFYRANDGPESVEAPKSQPLAENLENDKSADVSGAPNFYAPAADVIRETTPPVTSGVRQFLTMDSSAESVQQIPDEFIPCSLNIMAFASHYKLPEEPKPKVPFNVGKSTSLKVSNCFNEYLKGDFTPAKLEKASATIKTVNPHHIAMILCPIIGNIPPEDKDLPKTFTVLSPKAKRLLLMVVKLAGGRLEFFDAILSNLEFSLLPMAKDSSSLTNVPIAVWYINLSSFYAALCRSQGFGLRCQAFIYDCLYGRHISSFLIIYVILSVFPWALPKAHSGPLGPLCYTIAYLIMKQGIFGNCPPNLISTYKVAPLRKKLAIHYGYKFSPDITRDHVIVDLVAKIKNKGSDLAIVLLCKSQGFKWTQLVANKFFFPVLNSWISDEEKDETLVVLITQILGKISRGFAGSVGTSFVSTSLKYMDLLLRIKSSLPIVDAVMESLVHFSRLDIDGVAKIISTWTPNDYRVTPSAVKSVQKILKVRIGSFWDTWTPKKR